MNSAQKTTCLNLLSPVKPWTKFRKYPFPGNVRELKAIVELAAVMTNTNTIHAEDVKLSDSSISLDFVREEATLDDYIKLIITHYLNKYDQ